MRSKDHLQLAMPADAVAINRKMRGHEVRLAYSAQIALEISAKRRAVIIGLPATVARSGLRRHLVKPGDPQILQEFMVAPAKQLSTR
jgi:hypothetical protein